MNNTRRKQINKIIEQIESVKEDLACINFDESEYFESIPEHLESANCYYNSETSVDIMDDATSFLQVTIEKLQEIE